MRPARVIYRHSPGGALIGGVRSWGSNDDETGWARSETCGRFVNMRAFTAIVERCSETGHFVGYVPGLAGAHSQGETMEELRENLREVLEMLLEDGEPQFEAEFVGTQTLTV